MEYFVWITARKPEAGSLDASVLRPHRVRPDDRAACGGTFVSRPVTAPVPVPVVETVAAGCPDLAEHRDTR